MAETILSGSSVKTFLRCAKQWYYSYVAGISRPNNLYAIRGTAVHRAVEVNAREKMETGSDAPLSVLLDAYADSFDRQVKDGYLAAPDENPQRFFDEGKSLVQLYHTEVAPTITPVLVEQPFQIRINGQAYTGQIDMATKNEAGQIIIRDVKTATSTPSGNDHLISLSGYALAARALTGTQEADVVLDYLIIRKASMSYLPVSNGGPISDTVIGAFALLLKEVASQIESGLFPPTGVTNYACSRCPYRDICPAAPLAGR